MHLSKHKRTNGARPAPRFVASVLALERSAEVVVKKQQQVPPACRRERMDERERERESLQMEVVDQRSV